MLTIARLFMAAIITVTPITRSITSQQRFLAECSVDRSAGKEPIQAPYQQL
jgi:hypothetical protein